MSSKKEIKVLLEKKLLQFDFPGACQTALAHPELDYVKKVLTIVKEFMFLHLCGSCQYMMIYSFDAPRILNCIEKQVALQDRAPEWKQLLGRLIWLACRTKRLHTKDIWTSVQNMAIYLKKEGERASETFAEEVPLLWSKEFWDASPEDRLQQIVRQLNLYKLKHPASVCLLAVLASWVFILPERSALWTKYHAHDLKGNAVLQEPWIRKKTLHKSSRGKTSGDLWSTVLNIANTSSHEGTMLFCSEMAKGGTHLHFFSAIVAIAYPGEDKSRVHVNIPKPILSYLNGEPVRAPELPMMHALEETCLVWDDRNEEAYKSFPRVIKPQFIWDEI